MAQPHPQRWLVLLGVWVIYAAFGLIATSLAPLVDRIELDLDIGHTAMGSIMGAWQLVFIAAAIPCGFLLDRLGMRWALLLGALSIAASAWGRSIADDYLGMLLAVMIFGIGGPIISAGAPKVIANWFEGSSRGFAMGIYVTGPSIGGICSLSLTHPYFLPLFNNEWRPLFVLWAAVAVAAGIVWWLLASLPSIREQTDRIHDEAPLPHRRVIASLLAEPAVRVILWMSVGVFMISHGLMNWLPQLLVNYDMSHELAGYWATIPTIVGIVAALTIPRLATPKRRFLILAGLCSALLLATLALQFESRSVLFAGLMLQGTARATIMTVLVLTLVELPGVGDRYAGTAAGLFFAAAEFGGMLGPLAIGMLYDFTGGFTAGLAICTSITAGLLFGARRLSAMTGPAS
ncbi:MAG: CP family cyanate transporter-like MFS transporter [Gammaproteobacteria bacterium]|jgi:CP family cyanate transporter-like MFS transporter